MNKQTEIKRRPENYYQAPRLVVYGGLQQLTSSGSDKGSEGMGKGNMSKRS
jgi:hypothetical protein